MSEQQKRDIDLDAVIDAVGREMTNLEAPAGLRADVMARLEGRGAAGGFAVPRWALAAAAVIVIALGVALTQWVNRPSDPANGTNAQSTTASLPTRPVTVAANIRTNSTKGPDSTTRPPVGQVAQPAASATVDADAAEPDFGPPRLAAPPPIAIDALAPGAIDIAEMQVPALEQIQPIAIKDIPIGSTDPQRR